MADNITAVGNTLGQRVAMMIGAKVVLGVLKEYANTHLFLTDVDMEMETEGDKGEAKFTAILDQGWGKFNVEGNLEYGPLWEFPILQQSSDAVSRGR